jgi:NAD(P)-dependent dehydrogenase (short-subunit alcohol dehydrogenase family)
MKRLQNRVALITGGARGQGAIEAQLFAEEGCKVAICDILDAEGAAHATSLTDKGYDVRYFRLDVSLPHDWENVVAEVLAWAGRLDILVNNAGIINQRGIVDTDMAQWERVMAVNITGPFLGMRACATALRESGKGSVINIGSLASHVGVKCVAYSASKTALLGLTRTAASEFAEENVRVNCICPGTLETELTGAFPHFEAMRLAAPLKRHGEIGEIAQLVLFLASDDSSFITGTDINIDGGFIGAGALKLVHRLTQAPQALAALKEAQA